MLESVVFLPKASRSQGLDEQSICVNDMSNTVANDHLILIVSPDAENSRQLANSLDDCACQVESVAVSDEALQKAQSLHPDVVIVDASDGEFDPFDLSWQIRAKSDRSRAPIFVVSCCQPSDIDATKMETGCCEEAANTQCLESLLQRVTTCLNQPLGKAVDVVVAENLEIDRGRHRVIVNGELVQLTPTEFRLLWELANAPGYAFSRHELAENCLAPNTLAGVRTVDAHIKSLRRKLGECSRLIETVRGIGYRFYEQTGSITHG